MSSRCGAGPSSRSRAPLLSGLLAFAACAVGLLGATPALGDLPAPHWGIVSQAEPTHFSPGDPADAYRLLVRNDGGLSTAPTSSVTITDTPPAGLTATAITGSGEGPNGSGSPEYELTCSIEAIACTYEGAAGVIPGTVFTVTITVSVANSVEPPLLNSATVSGGGAPAASVSEPTILSSAAVPFGLAYATTDLAGPSGNPDTQAGSHPYELSVGLGLKIASREPAGLEFPLSNTTVKDLEVALPPGLLGDAHDLPQCPQGTFQEREGLNCPLDTQVGTIRPYFYGTFPSAFYPVYNIAPPPEQPAELGFTIGGIGHIPIYFHLRGKGDYGLTAQLQNLPSTGPIQAGLLTLWGVPSAPSHDLEREGTLGSGGGGEFCKPTRELRNGEEVLKSCPSGEVPSPFLTLPTSCSDGPLPVGMQLDSWQEPTLEEFSAPPFHPLTGCEELSFDPSISVRPEVTESSAPSGYEIDIHVPQNEDPSGLATPALKDASIALPPGLVLSPSAAGGLQSCTDTQFAQRSSAPASCPRASQLGSAQILTPLLEKPLEGQLFLGAPLCAPCGAADAGQGRLLRLFLQVQGSGLSVKLVGSIAVDQSSGQLTAAFDQNPQLPFEDLKLIINGGPRAPLANPSTCGVPLAATSKLTPYSAATPAEPSSAPFEVQGCTSPRFAPSFIAGTINNRAGAFSPETVTVSRTDSDQELRSITLQDPPGLLANLSGVSLCPDGQAESGACPVQSQIGTANLAVGPGATPFYLSGAVFLTGPYNGAPLGLAVAVPVLAGPLNLGVTVVRAALEVDPATAALTLRSDPLPQMLSGIPLQIKALHLDIDRSAFTVNPTSCRPMRVAASLGAQGGAEVSARSPFQASDCAKLAFQPKLALRLAGQANRGARPKLIAELRMPGGGANLKRVAVTLPATELLDNAHIPGPCTRLQFAEGRCPPGSAIGFARVLTPLLTKPLEGPVYLGSSGGKLPDLLVALRGQVDLDLDAHLDTFRGGLRATFAGIPDAPISKFRLALDGGRRGLLQNSRDICHPPRAALVSLSAQNGKAERYELPLRAGCQARKGSR